ncbi:hypothetical protein N752_09175 [Desulforamulus aquiferis]|nr:hypothetical protein N752_09175 [Desulforamulus aquiferis]
MQNNQKAPGSKGCLWHWGNNVQGANLKIDPPGPEAKVHPLTKRAE